MIIVSTGNNTAEKDNPINLSLAGDGFDTVIRAKAAVDAVPQCTNKVSCADILAMATRDVIALVRSSLTFSSDACVHNNTYCFVRRMFGAVEFNRRAGRHMRWNWGGWMG